MKIDIITIFPGMFEGVLDESMLRIAQEKGKCRIRTHDLREWTDDAHRSVDDKPYGGGGGMLMKVEPLDRAVTDLAASSPSAEVILLSPRGKRFEQSDAVRLAGMEHLVLICGHYGGVDERVGSFVDSEISVGDYILTCGEVPAMVVVDAVVRLLPGVLGDERSLQEESFEDDLLEAPRYTRPAEYKGNKVPDVLLSGDPVRISDWEHRERIELTKARRPDLIRKSSKNVNGSRRKDA